MTTNPTVAAEREIVARALVRSHCETDAEFDEVWADVEVVRFNALLDADRVLTALGIGDGRKVIVPAEPTRKMVDAAFNSQQSATSVACEKIYRAMLAVSQEPSDE